MLSLSSQLVRFQPVVCGDRSDNMEVILPCSKSLWAVWCGGNFYSKGKNQSMIFLLNRKIQIWLLWWSSDNCFTFLSIQDPEVAHAFLGLALIVTYAYFGLTEVSAETLSQPGCASWVRSSDPEVHTLAFSSPFRGGVCKTWANCLSKGCWHQESSAYIRQVQSFCALCFVD